MKRIYSLKHGFLFLILSSLLLLTGCNSDDDAADYTEWRDQNIAYIDNVAAQKDSDGNPLFERMVPSFAPGTYVLMQWHNDRALTQNNLSPLDNSTVEVAYELTDITGKRIDGNESARLVPCNTVVGFWKALTSMKVGDRVTAVVPFSAGYGESYQGNVKPYSTLIFSITLKDITGYEIKH